jgi:hypothetical protein
VQEIGGAFRDRHVSARASPLIVRQVSLLFAFYTGFAVKIDSVGEFPERNS